MSRFYFDLIWRGRRFPDEVGLDLSPGVAVRNAAVHAAAEHAIDVSSDENGRHEVQVRDAEGDVVLEVALEYGQRLEEPAL